MDPLRTSRPAKPSLPWNSDSALLPASAGTPIRRLGRDAAVDYRLGHELGRGGEGVVHAAVQAGIGRRVAVKRLQRHVHGSHGEHRFMAEAMITGRLEHPNIIPVHELGRDQDGSPFYAMKLVDGRPWLESMPQRDLDWNLDVLQRVGDAVAYAHAQGIVHRDLKPDNVMVGAFGEVLVMDWGMAVELIRLHAAPADADDVCGTPVYMAPEQALAQSGRIGPPTDVYLLGGILHEILSGCTPHPGDTLEEALAAAINNRIVPPPPDNDLGEVLRRALAADPDERFQSVAEFQQALRDCRVHAESRRLAGEAAESLAEARTSGSYQAFGLAIFRHQEALRRWPGNGEAERGLANARRTFIEVALERGDLELAQSMIAADPAGLADLGERAAHQRRQRRKRVRTIHRLRWAAAALGVLVLVGLATSLQQHRRLVNVLRQRDQAEAELAKGEMALLAEGRLVWHTRLFATFSPGEPAVGAVMPAGAWSQGDGMLAALADDARLVLDLPDGAGAAIRLEVESAHDLRLELGLSASGQGPAACTIILDRQLQVRAGDNLLAEATLGMGVAGAPRHLRVARNGPRLVVADDGRTVVAVDLPAIPWDQLPRFALQAGIGTTIDNLAIDGLEQVGARP